MANVLQETSFILHAPDSGGEVGGGRAEDDRRVARHGQVPNPVTMPFEQPNLAETKDRRSKGEKNGGRRDQRHKGKRRRQTGRIDPRIKINDQSANQS